ncbi:hypothetical protein [Parafrankia sp. FMc2]|uniref:hypothetical protein n=1 Tax=Parafrankia sp. FMc2 TaxID=3233196 RepID=UPI0034D536A0
MVLHPESFSVLAHRFGTCWLTFLKRRHPVEVAPRAWCSAHHPHRANQGGPADPTVGGL